MAEAKKARAKATRSATPKPGPQKAAQGPRTTRKAARTEKPAVTTEWMLDVKPPSLPLLPPDPVPAEPVAAAASVAAPPAPPLVPEPPVSVALPASLALALPVSKARGDALRQAMNDAVVETARGALDVNDKIIDAMQAQSDAAFEVWRSALAASHFSDAIRAQTRGTRQAYEAASAQWTDIAQTAAQWFNKSLEPIQMAFHRR